MGLLESELARWFASAQSDTQRSVLADALESSGTQLGALCSLQLRLSRLDVPVHAPVQARLGARGSFGPRELFFSHDYFRWKTAAENRVRDRRVKFELVKLWQEVLRLVDRLETGEENELTGFNTFVSIDRGVPAGLRTGAEAILDAPPLGWPPPHLEIICHSSTDFMRLLSQPVLEGLPSLALSVVGSGGAEGLGPGVLRTPRLALSSTDPFRDGFLMRLAGHGWLSEVQALRLPWDCISEPGVAALVAHAPRLKTLGLRSPSGRERVRPLALLGRLFELRGFSALRLEGIREFTSRQDWDAEVGPETTWYDLH